MILYIKNVLGGQNIKNEAGEILYSIKQEKFIGSTKLLFKDEKIIYKAEILNENEKTEYVVKNEKDEIEVRGILKFEDERGSLIYHPRVEAIELITKYGKIKAIQNKDLSVYFVHEDIVVGKLSPFLSIKSQTFACSEKFPTELWAILYILSNYMVHESDLITV